MFKIAKIKIGIMNCETGRIIKEKTVDPELALQEGEKISRWFDKKDTFFSTKPIWKHWENVGILVKFKALAKGNSWSDVAAESIVVFKGDKDRGEEHEFYMERRYEETI